MKAKFAIALMLAAVSALSQAAPTYEVVVRGAEPVRVVLNEAGEGSFESTEKALGVPAIILNLVMVNADANEVHITVDYREGAAERKSAQSILVPSLHQWSYRNRIKLSPTRTFRADDVFMKNGDSALAITRIE